MEEQDSKFTVGCRYDVYMSKEVYYVYDNEYKCPLVSYGMQLSEDEAIAICDFLNLRG